MGWDGQSERRRRLPKQEFSVDRRTGALLTIIALVIAAAALGRDLASDGKEAASMIATHAQIAAGLAIRVDKIEREAAIREARLQDIDKRTIRMETMMEFVYKKAGGSP